MIEKSLFGFDQEKIIHHSRTNAGKKNNELQNNLNTYYEEVQIQKELDEQSRLIQEEMLFEERAKGFSNPKLSRNRQRLSETVKFEKDLMRVAVANFLTETVMSALIFDQDFIDRNKQSLHDNIYNFFKEAYDNKIVDDATLKNCSSYIIQESYNELNKYVKKLVQCRDKIDIFNEDVIMSILNEAPKAKNASNDIADAVKDKVEGTLEKEKKISKKKEDEKEKDKDTDDAADSLDDDVPEEGDATDSNEDTETDDTNGDTDMSTMDDDSDGDTENSMDSNEDDTMDDDSTDDSVEDGSDDTTMDDESMDDNGDDTMDTEDGDGSMDGTSDGNNLKITVETNGTQVTVSANKSETMDYINIFGSQKYKERNSKTLFRNLLESNLIASAEQIKNSVQNEILTESLKDYFNQLKEKRAANKAYNEQYKQWQKLAKEQNKSFFPCLSKQEVDKFYEMDRKYFNDGNKYTKQLVTMFEEVTKNVKANNYIKEQMSVMRYWVTKYQQMYNVAKSKLSESGFIIDQPQAVNMDMVLGESLIDYTILETLYTSKIIDAQPSQIKNFTKYLNFKRK